MKVISFLYVALLGAAAASAAPAPDAAARAEANRFCGRPGQYCWKVKRAADAMADAMAAADADAGAEARRFCGEHQYCWTKRDAMPEADAEARRFCGERGQFCWKAKRHLEQLQAIQDDWSNYTLPEPY